MSVCVDMLDLAEACQWRSCFSVFGCAVWVAIRYRCSLIQVPASRDAEIKMLPTRRKRSHQGMVKGQIQFTYLSARGSLGVMDESGCLVCSSQLNCVHDGCGIRLRSDEYCHDGID